MLYLKELDPQLITWQKMGEVNLGWVIFHLEDHNWNGQLFKIENDSLGRKKIINLLNGFMKSW